MKILLPRRHHRRRNGKIARLPEATRERINIMLDDGLRYRAIIQALGPPGTPDLPYPLSEMNLSNWFRGGHQDWLRRQEHLEVERSHPLPRPNEPQSVRNLLQFLSAHRAPAAQAPACRNTTRPPATVPAI